MHESPHNMTELQIQLIQQQWEWLKPDAKIIGRSLYNKLFVAAPFIRHLFNDDITEQSCKMAAVITFVVSKLHRLNDILPDIRDIGAKHSRYVIPSVQYDLIGNCLMETLRESTGDKWTIELQGAWITLYEILKTNMIEAEGNGS